MIKLTKRQTNIIEILLEEKGFITIVSLSKKLNVSERTIRYDLDDIDYWMKEKGLVMVRKPNLGIWIDLNGNDKEAVKEALNTIEPYEYVLTVKERQDIIILLMLLSDTPISAQFIADELQISRNTVINDLKNIKLILKDRNLKLISRPKFGFQVSGSELSIRKIINALIMGYIQERDLMDLCCTKGKDKNLGIAIKLIYSSCKDIKISDIKNAVKESKKIYDFWIPDNSYTAFLIDLMITIKRIYSKNLIEFSKAKINSMKELKEFRLAQVIGEYLSSIYKISFNVEEIVYISYSLLNNNLKLKDFNDSINKDEEGMLNKAVSKMIKTAEKHININSKIKEKLKQDLMAHMSLTLKKLKIKIENKNPLLDDIKQTYSEEFVIAKEMLQSFTSLMDIQMDEDEAGYVTIILAAQIESQKKNKSKKALIVCSTGKGSAKILFQRIKNTIPELEILGTFSVFELEDYPEKLNEADVVISTVYFKTEDKPLIKVSPFVSGSDIFKIKSFLYEGKEKIYNKQAKQEEYILGSVMETVGRYVDKNKIEKVSQDLNSTINSLFREVVPISNEIEHFEKYSEKIAMTIIEMGEMLNELYEKGVIEQKDKNLFPITIHIIMAVPRWKAGDYLDDIDLDKYKEKNLEMFNIINKHLQYVSKKYSLNVPETEVVSLMRYLL